MKPTTAITHEDISNRAREIWEQAGRPEGRDTEHWLRAEQELRNEQRQAAVPAAAGSTVKAKRKGRA